MSAWTNQQMSECSNTFRWFSHKLATDSISDISLKGYFILHKYKMSCNTYKGKSQQSILHNAVGLRLTFEEFFQGLIDMTKMQL